MNPSDFPSNGVRWSTLYGTFYYFLGKTMVDTFGTEGEETLRQAIRDYGDYRATANRARHESLGLPINLETQQAYADMPEDSLTSEGAVVTPSYKKLTITRCTLYNIWKAFGDDIGRIYCEEVHHPLYCGYADRIKLDMPEFLTKGDDICTFIFTFDGAEEPRDVSVPEKEKGPGRSLESTMARLTGIMYEYLANAMLKRFGKNGQTALEQALCDYAFHRGKKLRQAHIEQGVEITPLAMFENGDVPCGDSIVMTHTWETPQRFVLTITRSELFDAFREIEGDQRPVGHTYMTQVPKHLWQAYGGSGDVRISKSHTLGDPVTVIEIDMK